MNLKRSTKNDNIFGCKISVLELSLCVLLLLENLFVISINIIQVFLICCDSLKWGMYAEVLSPQTPYLKPNFKTPYFKHNTKEPILSIILKEKIYRDISVVHKI